MLKVGLLGAGRIAGVHATAITTNPGSRLVAVSDINAEAAAKLAEEGIEAEVDALLQRQRGRDPDLWIIEVEDRQGRTLLDQDGLKD